MLLSSGTSFMIAETAALARKHPESHRRQGTLYDVIDLALIAMLTEGHLLLEDVPGTGKTTLAKTIAASLGCSFRRVQFTPTCCRPT
jgi:MoxR-like ATPase